ncbi:MAG: PRC-barrel domain-containing protein [Pseudomonadota bacterium]
MTRLFATSALVLSLATPAIADTQATETTDNTTATKSVQYVDANKSDILASELIGMRIYATEKAVQTDGVEKGAEREWNDIGEVNNVLLSRDGAVKAVVLGVGGFLGIGEKDVAMDMKSIQFVKENGSEDFFLVVNSSKEMLEKAPAYKRKNQ